MMLTPEPGIDALNKLEAVLLSTEKRDPIRNRAPAISPTDQKLSMREALFSPSEELPLGACRGRILASASITCPPAIPILICGEEITVEAIACMEYYGITACRVVDTTGAFRRKTPQ
jgi:arginine/lysine/ornithine decarboxylase